MKLISKFHDYYDGLINLHGYDSSGNMFFRDPETLSSKDIPLHLKFLTENFNLGNTTRYGVDRKQYKLSFFRVLVVGKIYGGVKVEFDTPYDPTKYIVEFKQTLFFYSFELFEDFMTSKQIEFDSQQKSSWWTDHHNRISLSKTKEHFNVIDQTENSIVNKLVIALITPAQSRSYNIEFNGELKKIEFYRVMDAYTLWQELSMYIDGCLSSPGNKMIEIEDKYKIEGHGFDSQYGFRTRPKN